jgi:hypothetical protein
MFLILYIQLPQYAINKSEDDKTMNKNSDQLQQNTKDLTLLLLYLTSWSEDEGFDKIQRSWKGYPFDVLNELSEDGFISGSNRAKSVYFTDHGIAEAEELVKKYLSAPK